LEDTEYIKPGDPSIQQKSAEIRGTENDSFSVVQKLLSWIANNIKTDIFAETLTGPHFGHFCFRPHPNEICGQFNNKRVESSANKAD
jgi:hypothetical protein